MNISVSVEAAALTSSLSAIISAIKDKEGMHGAIATAVTVVTRDHLTSRYLPKDGPRGDFWADVINGITSTSDESAATVSLNELGIRLRYEGGEVTPGKSISSYTGEITRALAIPSDKVPVAGGRQIRPGRAGILAFIQKASRGETVGFLVEGEERISKRGKNKGKPYAVPKAGGSLLYTLRTITRHNPAPGILPSEAEIMEAAARSVADFVGSFDGE
jgi:hypothetical protein